jgi:D-alanyl-D-alanine carboxypeptidase (penicillin-binding protein 5/6)
MCVAAALALASIAGWAPGAVAAPGDKQKKPQEQGPPALDAKAWMLVDAATGDTLAGRATTSQRSIASTTKLMTAYLALRELPLHKRIPAAEYQPTSPLETLADLAPGERLTVEDLLYALLLGSANDAAVTLAEGVSGSVPKFVREMNQTAAAIGLTNTSYENPIGLDSSTNYSSAADLAALTERLRRDRAFRRIVDTEHAVLKSGDQTREITNRNSLLFQYPWVTGVKTGHTQTAGYVLVGSGTQRGATLVSVVLGTSSESARNAETLKLLDYGFSQFDSRQIARQGERIASSEIRNQGETLPLVAAQPLEVGIRRGQKLDTTTVAPTEVEGPIKRGKQLGELTATVDGREVGTVPLVARRSVEEASTFEELRSRAFPWGIVALIVAAVILLGLAAIRRARRRRPRSVEERMRSQEERMRRRGQEHVGPREGGEP